jgi:hypothetical protein
VVEQVRAKTLDAHDSLTRAMWEMYEQDLVDLAGGGRCSDRWAAEVLTFNLTPLDESAGEGYHRSTTCVRKIASGAKSPYIKQSTRFAENLKRVRSVIRDHGKRGKDVVRFDWRTWTRILQSKRSLRWRPKRMKPIDIFRRVYRMDPMASEDWSRICSRIHAHARVDAAKEPIRDALAREYAAATFAPLTYYSVQDARPELDGDGQPHMLPMSSCRS